MYDFPDFANSAVVQNILLFSLNSSDLNGRDKMTVGHCLRDHGTETKNNFDCVTHSLK